MTDETRKALEKEWNEKVLEVLTEEFNKEVELDIKKTSPDAVVAWRTESVRFTL